MISMLKIIGVCKGEGKAWKKLIKRERSIIWKIYLKLEFLIKV